MTNTQKFALVLLRISLGWLFFYAGITKVLDPAWSAAGYLQGATTFSGFFAALLNPSALPLVNILNEWGLVLIGVSLMLGAFVRSGALAGMLLMLLYYLAGLHFPYPNEHSYIVDEHIIYIFALLVLFSQNAGEFWGLERKVRRIFSR